MKASHFAFAALVSVVVAFAGDLLVSPYGSESYSALSAHRIRLETNITELKDLNITLRSQAELLARSSDAVRLEARVLGYYDASDTVIRLENSSPPARFYSAGRVILGKPSPVDQRSIVRAIAIISGLAALLVLLLVQHAAPHPSIIRPSK